MHRFASKAALLAVVVASSGCGGSEVADRPATLTWEEFKAAAYVEPDTGVFITNGDELAETEEELRAQFDRYASQAQAVADGVAEREQPLIVNRVNGRDDQWSPGTNAGQAMNLTYCVSSGSFGSRYATVVSAMTNAAAAWEGTARVNFVHLSQYDGSCSNKSPVVFNVRQVRTPQYLARAFFPSTSRSGREILISTSSFGNINPWTLTGVLRHELGHTIGFRHEHTRPEAAACFEDNSWRALTAYDSSSVMHYPQCNGTQTGDLVLTSLDKTGARALYP